MKAVIPSVSAEFLALRKQSGADRWDEMWEGVLHMPPAPNVDHQDLEWALETWLRTHWNPRSCGRVNHQVNVARPGRWPRDYRIPDLALLLPDRSAINRNEYFEGGPNVVVEIESEGDETWEKLAFYAEVGVQEAWIVERDTKRPQVVAFAPGDRREVVADSSGWLLSKVCGVELRSAQEGRLEIRQLGDSASECSIP